MASPEPPKQSNRTQSPYKVGYLDGRRDAARTSTRFNDGAADDVRVIAPNYQQALHFCRMRGWTPQRIIARPDALRGYRDLTLFVYNGVGMDPLAYHEWREVLAPTLGRWVEWGSDEIERALHA